MKKLGFKYMKILVLILFLSSNEIFAFGSDKAVEPLVGVTDQNGFTISGQVLDADTKEPLIGAAIVVKGTTIGTAADVDGKFTMEIPDGNSMLQVSYVGYTTAEIAVNNNKFLDIVLHAAANLSLDEVVVVGYGVQKKANVVGSVTTLNGSELKSIPATSLTNALSGRMPGLINIQNGGEPGNLGSRIMVRGRSTLGDNTGPLVIIDGVQGRSMDEIDPNDVANVSILKDASAAIYGASAANGVILITTKSGEKGSKPRLSYNFYQGFMTPTITPEMCDAAEYAEMLTDYQTYKGVTPTYTQDDIDLFRSGIDPWEHANTDWYDELIKKWTTTMRHNVTIDGGYKGMTYYVSFGYKKDDAIYRKSSTSYDQYNLRAKMNFPITDWLDANLSSSFFEIDKAFPYKSAANIFGSATRTVPTMPAYWPTGEPGPDVENGENPVVTSSFDSGKNQQKRYKYQNQASVTIKVPFIEGLKLNASYDYDVTQLYQKQFYHPWTLYYPNWSQATRDPNTGFVTSMPLTPVSRGLAYAQNTEKYDRTINKTFNVNALYTRAFGDHNVTAFLAYEQYETNGNWFSGYRENYVSNLIDIMDVGSETNKNANGSKSVYARKSLIGRLTYAYQDKYLAEFLYRRDGSLKFPPESRWGNFPGFLLGYRISEEPFWKDNIGKTINYLKLRASFGMMGMDPGSSFQYMDKYTLSKVIGMVFGSDYEMQTTLGPPSVANPYITWEQQKTQNYGFESQFFNGLISFDFDYFKNVRTDILAPRNSSVPRFTGLTLPDENIARVDNKGFEIQAGFHKSFNKDLRVDVKGNFNFNRNKVVYNDEPQKAEPWQYSTGHPYGARLMYRAIGVFDDQEDLNSYPSWGQKFQKNGNEYVLDDKGMPVPELDANGNVVTTALPGDIIFEDYNKDGMIDSKDRVLIDGCNAPEITYGLDINIAYKRFNVSMLFQGAGTYYKDNLADDRRGEGGNYPKWLYDDHWTVDNTDATIPRPFNRTDQYWKAQANTFWLDNTAYLRFKNLVVGYDLPVEYFKKVGITRFNVFFSGNNLCLLYTATKKFDPEVNGMNTYPQMRTFAVGANVTF